MVKFAPKTKQKKVETSEEKDITSSAPDTTIHSETNDENPEATVEKKLRALYNLQQIDTQIDKIRIVRGELPLEVCDLEDEIEGLETRIKNLSAEIQSLDAELAEKKEAIKASLAAIKKYTAQQMNVRNNREYDSLTKEIEYQNLEIQLAEKRIKEYTTALEDKKLLLEQSSSVLNERKADLETKKSELEDIITETEKEEKELMEKSVQNQSIIEERFLTAYKRIRKNARNGLAVVQVERDACGGCFNKIPPQKQMDIRMHKKIIVCEYCGRILIDNNVVPTV
jgi:predicted  nucleic acid-binding Zn-ribbon protein